MVTADVALPARFELVAMISASVVLVDLFVKMYVFYIVFKDHHILKNRRKVWVRIEKKV